MLHSLTFRRVWFKASAVAPGSVARKESHESWGPLVAPRWTCEERKRRNRPTWSHQSGCGAPGSGTPQPPESHLMSNVTQAQLGAAQASGSCWKNHVFISFARVWTGCLMQRTAGRSNSWFWRSRLVAVFAVSAPNSARVYTGRSVPASVTAESSSFDPALVLIFFAGCRGPARRGGRSFTRTWLSWKEVDLFSRWLFRVFIFVEP